MKKRVMVIFILALLILAGCRQKEPEVETPPAPPAPPVEEEQTKPIHEIDELRVEISRGEQKAEQLSAAVRDLPTLLKTYLEEASDMKIGKVRVTVGASAAATAQSLEEGKVDIAFLPAEDFLLYGEDAKVLFADGSETEEHILVGKRGLICAAPTEYGRQLAQRAGSGKPLSWQEITRARWGVLSVNSLEGYRNFDLWLSEGYEGRRITDLSHVAVYKTGEEIFRAAAEGRIDAFVIRDDARTEMAEAWMLDVGQTDANNVQGFGRTEQIWDEVAVLDVTERICGVVAAVAPEQEVVSAEVLGTVLERLRQENPELMPVLGAEQFVRAEKESLQTVRDLIQLEE